MKSEPDVYSIEDLEKEQEGYWDGVRNYQARNFMRDEMQVGDLVLFYHSNAKPPGIAGIAAVSKKASPDPTQFDPKSDYYDPKATQENPRWHAVYVKFVEKFAGILSLDDLKKESQLSEMLVLKKGQRLSIQPVQKEHFDWIRKQGRKLN